jgi:hypothetical protein
MRRQLILASGLAIAITSFTISLQTGAAVPGTFVSSTPDWIQEFVSVRVPQTKVVRHPTDRGKFYLCWAEGAHRYALSFRRSNFDSKLRTMQPGGSASLATMMPISPANLTSEEQKLCWG